MTVALLLSIDLNIESLVLLQIKQSLLCYRSLELYESIFILLHMVHLEIAKKKDCTCG